MTLARILRSLVVAAALMSMLAALGVVAGCAGYTQYKRSADNNLPLITADGISLISPGKLVRVRTVNGEVVAGKVDSIGQMQFVVAGRPVLFTEVDSIQVRGVLWVPTVVAVGVATFVVRLATLGSNGFTPDAK
ncbi:MAG: hypothetical protein ACYDIE_01395 [Candidatus Krumholzibacteriia bacterium]